MSIVITPQAHLDDIAREAAEYYDRDDQAGAIACVTTRMKDHPQTAHLAEDSFLMLMVLRTGWDQGRQGFVNAVTGFSVN